MPAGLSQGGAQEDPNGDGAAHAHDNIPVGDPTGASEGGTQMSQTNLRAGIDLPQRGRGIGASTNAPLIRVIAPLNPTRE